MKNGEIKVIQLCADGQTISRSGLEKQSFRHHSSKPLELLAAGRTLLVRAATGCRPDVVGSVASALDEASLDGLVLRAADLVIATGIDRERHPCRRIA